MANSKAVNFSVSGHVATITLNRPDVLNAINADLRYDLDAAVDAALRDDAIRVILLTGAGKNFCAGQDLNDAGKVDAQILLEEHYKPLLLKIVHSPKPFICAINGACAGIGLAFALACDLVLMGEHAYLYLAFATINRIPDGGVCWHLVNKIKLLEVNT